MTTIEALYAVADAPGPVAAGDIPASRQTFTKLRDAGLIKAAGYRNTGERGRPARIFVLSARGAKRLQRLQRLGG